MNSRDRAFTVRELEAWGWWIRAGRTIPNRLGFRGNTVEYNIMKGILAGGGRAGAAVPYRFNLDPRVEKTDLVVLKLPDAKLVIISGIYVKGMSQADLALSIGKTRGQFRWQLESAHIAVFAGIVD